MNLRKLLYLPTTEQKAILAADIEHILVECDKIATHEWKELKENQKAHDGQCPKCKAREDDIVNKIRQVQGNGNVGGSFYLGFGSVSGSMSIDTDEVNHCNKCGNEWKKFKTKYISKTDILRVALNYLADIIDNPAHNKRMTWKTETCQVFDGCRAEAIRILVDKHSHNLHLPTNGQLRLGNLRRHYKSVFDVDNKKELEKL